jgi:thioester reductase-like protein
LLSKDLLLTGSTGFFGAFLLSELVNNGSHTVNCLIRGQDEEHCWRRLRENLSHYLGPGQIREDAVNVIPGELSKPLLGLPRDRFDELAEKTAAVYHNGALVSSFSSPSKLRETNVDSTLWLVKLVTTAAAEMHYISSDSAGASARSAYGESKRQAEKIVLGAAERGVAARVYRLPRLAGDSRTGKPNKKDLIFRMIDIMLRIGFAPDIDLVERWIPVDVAARALVDTARESRAGRAVYVAPRGKVSMPYLLSVAREHGFAVKVEDADSWIARVRTTGSVEDEVTVGALKLGDPAPEEKDVDDFEIVETPGSDRDTLDQYFRWYRTQKVTCP